MRKKNTTQEHINKIIEFRQAIHANGFGKERDALSEALDALCLTGSLSSFPLLSLQLPFSGRGIIRRDSVLLAGQQCLGKTKGKDDG